MARVTRYQGAIMQDGKLLLIQHKEHASGRSYWLVPGGGREDGETEEACVRREMKEETHLDVRVLRLLLDEPATAGRIYRRYKTYLCEPLGGEARPGSEPEAEAAAVYSISAVRWIDLQAESDWGPEITHDPITYPQLCRIRAALGAA